MRTKPSAFLLPLSLLISISAFGQRPAPTQAERVLGAVNSVSVASWGLFAELAPKNGTALDFGASVSVDTNVAVVGSDGDSAATGAAYVFVKSSGGRNEVGPIATLTASDGQPGDGFGASVSISGDVIVVGADGVNNGQGKAYLFVKPKNGWTNMTETAQLTASDGQSNDQFARAVSISGGAVAVGAAFHMVGSSPLQGAVYVFVEPPTGWADTTQTAELTASDGVQNSRLGWSVAMAGNTVAAGASGVGSAVYVFVEPSGGWVNATQTAKLTDPKDTGIGFAVGVSADAATIVAGSPFGGPDERGAAHVYVRQGGTWQTTSKDATLLASDGVYGDYFGNSVATIGSTVLVGAPNAHCKGNLCTFPGTGIVYTYQEPPTGWKSMSQTQELSPSDGKSEGYFGQSVAAQGSAVVVGAPGTDTAYVYMHSSNAEFK